MEKVFINNSFISNYLPAMTIENSKAVGHDGSFVLILSPTQAEDEVRLTIHTYDTEHDGITKPTNDIGTASIKMTQATAATLFYQMNEAFNFCDSLKIPESLQKEVTKISDYYQPISLQGLQVI